MKKVAELVFIPSPGAGHLVSAVEIAKLLVARDDQIFITVLIMKLPFDSMPKGTVDVYTDSMSQRIKFVDLPKKAIKTRGINPSLFFKFFIENHKAHVKDAITKLSESDQSDSKPRLAGFFIDLFCTSMIDVADEFGVPTYIFFTSSAGFLGLMFHLQTLHDEQNKDWIEFKDSDAELVVSSFVNDAGA